MVDGPAKLPQRLLVVAPTWVGDVVMATPTFRILREKLPGALLGVLLRPGVKDLLDGTDFFDEVHVEQRAGMMGPKKAAAKIRPMRYDAALLLTNSFSSALATRLAFIPRRFGYDRDSRGFLLTDRIKPPLRKNTAPYNVSTTDPNAYAPIPACDYYLDLARLLLDDPSLSLGPLELAVTDEENAIADDLLTRAGLDPENPNCAILNPGGNNPAKRWPADRFAQLAHHLQIDHSLNILINGSPAESELAQEIIQRAHALAESNATAVSNPERLISLPELGMPLRALKPLAQRAKILITNDTGPRHIAAAFGTPVLTLFGPTDRRWTTIPFDKEIELDADPTLPEEEVTNDHPDRCAVENITFDRVVEATERLLGS